jgi:hypothetical protein
MGKNEQVSLEGAKTA